MADWSGFRIDSKDPIDGGEEIIAWWRGMGQDPHDKLLIFSDGLDIDSIERAYHHFAGRVRLSFGWGTLLTNDLRGCSPVRNPGLDPHLAGLQGDSGERSADRQAVRQPGEGIRVRRRLIEHYKRVFGSVALERKRLAV